MEILADLEKEGWSREYTKLLALMKECNEEFIRDPYPYSSEIAIDETAQHQVCFFTKLFAELGLKESKEKYGDVVRVLKALRGGDQPVWFSYGVDLFAHPDLRGQIACWHSSVLNGMALLRHFEKSGDLQSLQKGYPGVMSVMSNVLSDGMGFWGFMLKPGVFNHEPPRTFEGGLGLWGFLRAAKAYVVEDRWFGLVGYGCRVKTHGNEIHVFPRDGVKKRVRFVAERIDVEAVTGEITCIQLNKKDGSLRLQLSDSTDLVKTAHLVIKGLQSGNYKIEYDSTVEQREVKDILRLEFSLYRTKNINIRKA